MRLNRHLTAAILALLAFGAGLAAQLSDATLVEDAGVVAIVVALVTLAVAVPRIVLGPDGGRRMGRS
ncbi:MAG: hypothetical protein JWR30_495 [Conexibacter sp.]|nr:hypothetical protein [Conexibacter sp.]